MKITALITALALGITNAFSQPPRFQVDMGDLPQCRYPTLWANPAHSVSDIAWLGECITAEVNPHAVGQDSCDDGVTFLNPPWTPCTMVQVHVVVTGGPYYPVHVAQGGLLYLNAWKDGNLDGDFCDILCDGQAPEWIIQDVLVTPGVATYTFLDPCVFNMGIYEGVFRFRLTHNPVGPYGFGLTNQTACPSMTCGTWALDGLGEVEDYVIPDLVAPHQLALTSPNGGETLPSGTLDTVRWTYTGPSTTLLLKLNRDFPEGAWEILATGINPADGQWAWSVSGPPSATCRIAVISETSPTVADTSDADFSITTSPIQVTNIAVAQRPFPSELVTISYDVIHAHGLPVAVTMQASSDGGGTWTVPVDHAVGDVGPTVQPGIGRTIIWNAGLDWPEMQSDSMRIRIQASDQ